MSGGDSITGDGLLARIDAGRAPTILDVRSRLEFVLGRVPGARHIPFWTLPARAGEIPMSAADPIVVYCGHGPRAWIAAAILRRRGFRHIVYLEGHMSRWQRDGLRQEAG